MHIMHLMHVKKYPFLFMYPLIQVSLKISRTISAYECIAIDIRLPLSIIIRELRIAADSVSSE